MSHVIVVGAGWFGLIAAQTYLSIHPTHTLLILESAASLGGVWSRARVYRGMITHNHVGALEISAHPLRGGNPTPEGYIRGEDVAEYLHSLADRYDLYRRIRYGSAVTAIDRDPRTAEWVLTVNGGKGGECRCVKLIMATGMTSAPYTPDIPITAPTMRILHSADLAAHQDFLEGAEVGTVTVTGGSKSAFDTAHLCATAGKKVHWILRGSAAPMFTAKALGTTSAWLAPKRILNALSPCIYNLNTPLSRFLHGTALGVALVRGYWTVLTKAVYRKHRLQDSENGRKLTPRLGPLGPFWSGSTPTGVVSQTGFWENIHPVDARVTVHEAAVVAVEHGVVVLSTGGRIRADAHVWATGWDRRTTPFCAAVALDAGVPVPVETVPPGTAERWSRLEARAEVLVRTRFLLLAEAPVFVAGKRTHTPYRLYRNIAPVEMAERGDCSLVFVGMLHTSATGMVAEVQALWAVAYLDGVVRAGAGAGAGGLAGRRAQMEEEVAAVGVWGRRRYGRLGEKCANLTFEFLPYIDTLLTDLGVNPRRKSSWWEEWFGTYTPRDYEGVLAEVVGRFYS